MRKLFLIIVFMIGISTYIYADIDSDVDYYIDLIETGQYSFDDFDAFKLNREETLVYNALELFLQSKTELDTFNYSDAYVHLEDALVILSADQHLKLKVEILYYLAELDLYFNNITSGSKRSIELRQLATEINYIERVIEADYNMAFSYIYNYDYNTGVLFAEEAFDLCRDNNYKKGFVEYYLFLANLSFYNADYETAKSQLVDALMLLENTSYPYVIETLEINVLRHLAFINILYLNSEEGYKTIEDLQGLLDQNNNYQSYFINDILGHYYNENDLEMAFKYFYDALNYYELSEVPSTAYPMTLDLYESLGNISFELKNYQNAATYYFEVLNHDFMESDKVIEDVLTGLDDIKNEELLSKMSLIEELNSLNEEKINLSKRLLWVLIIGIVMLSVTVVIIIIEMRAKSKTQDKLYEASITDGLTSLYNRSKIIEVFSNNLKPQNAIILLDVDNFKDVNDTYGHIIGDEVLVEIGQLIKISVRENDKVGRYGGEEFLLYLDDISENELLEVAERIREAIEVKEWPQKELKTTVSIGLTNCFSVDPEEVLHKADTLMYRAKHSGKNRVVYN